MRCPDCDTLGTRPCPTHYASHNQEDSMDETLDTLREQVARLTAERDELRERQSRVWTWGMEPGAVPVPAVVEFDSKATSELRERLAQAERERAESRARVEELEGALRGFMEQEWASKADWQGMCAFRRLLGCDGTDGHGSAMGTPKPRPHAEHCPYSRAQSVLSSPGSRKEGA